MIKACKCKACGDTFTIRHFKPRDFCPACEAVQREYRQQLCELTDLVANAHHYTQEAFHNRFNAITKGVR